MDESTAPMPQAFDRLEWFRIGESGVYAVLAVIEGHFFQLSDLDRDPRELQIDPWTRAYSNAADAYAKIDEFIERGLVKMIYEEPGSDLESRAVWLPHTLDDILRAQEKRS